MASKEPLPKIIQNLLELIEKLKLDHGEDFLKNNSINAGLVVGGRNPHDPQDHVLITKFEDGWIRNTQVYIEGGKVDEKTLQDDPDAEEYPKEEGSSDEPIPGIDYDPEVYTMTDDQWREHLINFGKKYQD